MEEKKYLNVLLTTAGDNKDERNDLLASIDISEENVVKGLIDFYYNMNKVEGSKFVESIGAIVFKRSFFGKNCVSYSTNIDYNLLGKDSYYYSRSYEDEFEWSPGTMNLEITIDCLVGIISFSTYNDGKRYIGCILISDFIEDEK